MGERAANIESELRVAPCRVELSDEEGKDDSKREDENYRVQETEGATAGLLGTGGLQGQGTRPTPRARGVHGSSEEWPT